MSENINITPEMINNLVNGLKSKNSSSNNSSESNSPFSDDIKGVFSNFSSDSSNSSANNNIDINTILKIKSIIDTLNKKDDPNSNLLYSLKPYLRKSKQEKLDQYANILKISKIVNLFSKNQEDAK